MSETISELEAALRQLDVAIELFLAGDFLCSLTLAGTAESISNDAVNQLEKGVAGKIYNERSYDIEVDETNPIRQITWAIDNLDMLGLPQTARQKEFIFWLNQNQDRLDKKIVRKFSA